MLLRRCLQSGRSYIQVEWSVEGTDRAEYSVYVDSPNALWKTENDFGLSSPREIPEMIGETFLVRTRVVERPPMRDSAEEHPAVAVPVCEVREVLGRVLR